ncbi:MAG: helix-turn-helix domain-containing protein [Lysobacterales bacterium]
MGVSVLSYDLQLMIQLVQLASGQAWVPPEVRVSEVNAGRLSRSKEFERVRIRHSDTFTCLVLPIDMLALPMTALVRPVGLQLPGPLADNFLDSLSAVIGTYLQDGNLNIHLAAEMAGLSKRTFQRRLGDLQFDYNTLIDQVRLKQALSLLIKPDVTVTEIAFDLGYSEPAHFTRAFRRWTALSPREYPSASARLAKPMWHQMASVSTCSDLYFCFAGMPGDADGSCDVSFAPKAPAGKEDSLLQSIPGNSCFPILRTLRALDQNGSFEPAA